MIRDAIQHLYPWKVTLKRPLRYYTGPDRNSPVALELKAGEEYYVISDDYLLGEGNRTLPTYQRGWRCAAILRSVKPENQDHTENLNKRYYVNLGDLRRIQRDCEWDYFLKDPLHNFGGPFYITYGSSETGKKKDYLDIFTECDSTMYRLGQYISPDLKKPLWDIWNTLFLTGAVLCLIAPPVCRKVKRRGEPATD